MQPLQLGGTPGPAQPHMAFATESLAVQGCQGGSVSVMEQLTAETSRTSLCVWGGVFLKHGLCRVTPLLRGRSWLPRTTRILSCRLKAFGRQGQVPPGLSAFPPLCLSHPNSGHTELLHVTLNTPPPSPPHPAFPHLLPTSPAQQTLIDPPRRTQEVPSSMKPSCRPLDCGKHAPHCTPVPPRGLSHVRTPHSSAPNVHNGLILSFHSSPHSRPSVWDALFSVT